MSKENVNKQEIIDKVTPAIEEVAGKLGLTVLEVDFVQDAGSWHLRVFVYSPDHSISHADCGKMTKELGEQLDSLISIPYCLEVSSPGIERKLKSPIEYNIFRGQNVDIKLKQPQEDLKRFIAKIIEYTPETGLEVEILDTGKVIKIQTENISSIRLKADFNKNNS